MMKNSTHDIYNVRRRNNGRNQQSRQDTGSHTFGQHDSILPYSHSHNANTREGISNFKHRSFSTPKNKSVERTKKLLSMIVSMIIAVICLVLYFKRGVTNKNDVVVEVSREETILDGETDSEINSMLDDIRNKKKSIYDYKKNQEDNFGLTLENIQIEEDDGKKDLGEVPPFQAAKSVTNEIIANVSYIKKEFLWKLATIIISCSELMFVIFCWIFFC